MLNNAKAQAIKTLLERVLSESKLADDKTKTGKDRDSLLIPRKVWDNMILEIEAKYLKGSFSEGFGKEPKSSKAKP